jgi:hypothetical protein
MAPVPRRPENQGKRFSQVQSEVLPARKTGNGDMGQGAHILQDHGIEKLVQPLAQELRAVRAIPLDQQLLVVALVPKLFRPEYDVHININL